MPIVMMELDVRVVDSVEFMTTVPIVVAVAMAVAVEVSVIISMGINSDDIYGYGDGLRGAAVAMLAVCGGGGHGGDVI